MTEKKRRTKPVKAKTITHPLQKFLGAFMRLERLRQRRSAPELAAAMNLSPGYIKMLESGAVPLNIAMADVFIKEMAAKHTEAVRDQRIIHFPRLTRYLAGSHWLAAQLGANESKGDRSNVVLKAMEELKDNDPEFERLYDVVLIYLDLKSEADEKEFLEKTASQEVEKFLRMESYALPEIDQLKEQLMPWRDFTGMPSMNVDMLMSFKKNIAYRAFLHTGEVAAIWEKENSPRFLSVVGVFEPIAEIVTPENVRSFQYEFLKNDNFKGVRFIFLPPIKEGRSAIELKSDFIGYLNAARGPGRGLSQKEKDLIEFVVPDSRSMAEFDSLLQAGSPFNRPLDAYWCLEVESGLKIAFVGNSYQISADGKPGMTHHNVLNLSLKESHERFDRFEILWANLTNGK